MEQNTHRDLKTLLSDALELKNVNQEKLAELTGISERYLWAIQNMEIDKLPPSPYVRGYLKKISEILHLNHDELWEMYKKELTHKTSGAHDTLPKNRFAVKHLSRREWFLIATGALLVIYFLFNFPRLLGEPELTVINPSIESLAMPEPNILLYGTLDRQDKLTINGEEAFVDENNSFSKLYTLQPGLNEIKFKAKRFLGKEVTITKKIIYQPTK